MFERFTDSARRSLFFAREDLLAGIMRVVPDARPKKPMHSGHTAIRLEHLSLGLLRDDGSDDGECWADGVRQ